MVVPVVRGDGLVTVDMGTPILDGEEGEREGGRKGRKEGGREVGDQSNAFPFEPPPLLFSYFLFPIPFSLFFLIRCRILS